jgi:hypothetical protein
LLTEAMKSELALTLVMNMKPLVALPDQRMIMVLGNSVPGLFVIVSGTCEYTSSDGTRELISKGDCFGYELLKYANPTKRIATASVKPLEICEFMFLSAGSFEALLHSKLPEHRLFIQTLNDLWVRGSMGAAEGSLVKGNTSVHDQNGASEMARIGRRRLGATASLARAGAAEIVSGTLRARTKAARATNSMASAARSLTSAGGKADSGAPKATGSSPRNPDVALQC